MPVLRGVSCLVGGHTLRGPGVPCRRCAQDISGGEQGAGGGQLLPPPAASDGTAARASADELLAAGTAALKLLGNCATSSALLSCGLSELPSEQ